MASLQERFVEMSSGRIRYLASGEGTLTVALWPGLGSTGEAFLRLLREGPEHGYGIAAIDAPGHGRSSRAPMRAGADAAAVFTAVLDDLGAGRAVIGGHSYGAAAALGALAASDSLRHRVQGLLLYDGGYLTEDLKEDPRENCQRHIEGFSFASWQELFDEVAREAGRWDGDLEAAVRAATVERDGRIRLRIDVDSCADAIRLIAEGAPSRLPPLGGLPALLLRAGRPAELEEERSAGVAALRKKLAKLEVQVIANVSHEILDEDPQAVARATWAFLGGL